jgi:hypothetical protein
MKAVCSNCKGSVEDCVCTFDFWVWIFSLCFAREVDFDLCVMLYFCHFVITDNVGQHSDVHDLLTHFIEFLPLHKEFHKVHPSTPKFEVDSKSH